ncbi:MAG: putative multi-sensor signal transduction histidine kinase [Acidimicrobiales bacterium]|nr:putative multi-sensor signal transduction histidine kinase [Acidimicrobiales bacterium]
MRVSSSSGGFVHGLISGAGSQANVPGPTGWDGLPDVVVITKSNGTVIFANRMTTALLGWPAGELVGQPVDVLVTEAHRPLVAVGAGWHDVTARHRAGEDVPVELWVAEEGSSVVIVARDRRPALAAAAEAALSARHRQQAERLDGLAELAGSLAHEFNNLLAVILSSVGFVSEAVTDLDGVDADLERIRDAAERGARLTRHLLGGTGPEARGRVDVGALVDDVGRLVEWGTRGDVRVRATPGLPAAAGDRRELEQLLLSLVLDPEAADAGAGRTVTLSTALVTLAPAEATALEVDHGTYVELAIACRATVYAVTAAYRLARRNGGALIVDDDALVRLLLPLADVLDAADAADVGDAAPVVIDLVERRTVVLVVDDTEALRELTARALQKHGYVVLEAGSGAEALRLVETNQIDLVLTDVVMPRMSGLELHDAIGSLPAPPPVVFMSGYSDAVLPEGPEVAPVLRKPFSEQDLLDHVRAAITLERKSGS